MHLIFFDEVKAQPDFPFYHIGAIAIGEKNLKDVEAAVNIVSKAIFGEIVLKKETEFRAHNIYHKKEQFKNIIDVQTRIDTILSLLQILAKYFFPISSLIFVFQRDPVITIVIRDKKQTIFKFIQNKSLP